MPAILANDHFGKLGRVGQVAVVRKTDAIRGVDIERLRLGGTVTACGRITDVADAGVSLELQHVLLLKHVPHEPAALAYVQLAVAGRGDTGGILPAMLEHGQCVIDPLIDRAGSDDADNSTHA